MPDKLISRLAKKKGVTIEESKRLWDKAKVVAESAGKGENYAYITGIYKKMMGENLSFKEFIMLVEEGEPTNTSDGTMPDKKPTDGKPKKKKEIFKNIKKNKNVESDDDTDIDSKDDDDDKSKDDDEVAKVN